MATLFGSVACEDPRTLKASCDQSRIPTEKWWGKANRFDLAVGRGPGRGWILLRKDALDSLDLTADHALVFSGEDAAHVVTLSRITLLHSECVSPGAEADPAAVYLCEIVDRRHFLGMVPLPDGYKAYNVAAGDGASFLTATKNGGSPYTWQQVIDSLVTILGLSTSQFVLPFAPHDQPENLVFDGCPAWETLCRVLDRLACGAVLDPTTDTFSVVRLGVSGDADLDALENSSRYKGLVWNGHAAEAPRGWRPEKVRVRFQRRPIDPDGASPYYVVDVTLAAVAGTAAGTFVMFDDDLTAQGATGSPANSALLGARASERATDWLRKRSMYERRLVRSYRDFQPEAVPAVGRAAARAVADDRGGLMQTWVQAEPDGLIEKFKPTGGYPPWWMAAPEDCDSYKLECLNGFLVRYRCESSSPNTWVYDGGTSIACEAELSTSPPPPPPAYPPPTYPFYFEYVSNVCPILGFIRTVNSTYTISYDDDIIHVATAGADGTLPDVTGGHGGGTGGADEFAIKNISGGSALVFPDPGDGSTIDGAASVTLAPLESIVIYNDSFNWWIKARA